MKGSVSGQPFVNDHPECILIAGQARFALQLLRSQVGQRPGHLLGALKRRALGDEHKAKITQEHFVLAPQQHILWFHISMDELAIMSILQSGSDLFGVRENGRQGNWHSFGVTLSQGAMRSIAHNQKGSAFLDAKLQNAHNMWVLQVGDRACLKAEFLNVVTCQVGAEHFDGRKVSKWMCLPK
jgi:hypothetical protein